jgi:glutathione synthase/RimK-type ligase-like ATP-grasp enzyme
MPSHAVRKVPAAGDYRVHEHWGGTVAAVDASAGAVELAARVCAALPAPTLYARIDLLPVGDLWRVLEVEVTEPSLFLDHAPTAIPRLVEAVMARVG